MSLSFDELFAMRLQIQDITTDEVIIIKRLKLLLLSSGMTTVEINNYLVLFYEYFGTTITLQEIQEINVNENSFLNFLLNNQLDGLDNNNNLVQNNEQNEINHDQENESTNEQENESTADQENESIDEQENESTNEQVVMSDSDEFDEFHEEYESIEQLLNTPLDNNVNPLNLPIPPNIPLIVPQLQNHIPNILFQNSFDLLGEFLNNTSYLPPPISVGHYEPFENDIQVTLDDNDLNNLEKIKCTKKLDDRCTICLMDIEKDDTFIRLKCTHSFHSKCLTEYLKHYGYSCPVCRTEVGKSKAHIN